MAPATVTADLGLHLMRFALMENQLSREPVLAMTEPAMKQRTQSDTTAFAVPPWS